MKYDKQTHNTKSITLFKNKVFSNIFRAYDISSDEKLLKCKVPSFSRGYFKETANDDKVEGVYLKGYELKDSHSKKTYLLPSKIKQKDGSYKPLMEMMPLKIKDSWEVYHGKKVYHWVAPENIRSVNFPESTDMSLRDFIDSWFNIEHSNPDDAFVFKIVALASHMGGFSRIIGDKGFGKDGWVNTLIGITGVGNNISKVKSDAKWIRLIDDKYTVFNEISGFGGERLEIAENFFLGTGDVNTPEYNHSTTGNESTGNKRDITGYSYFIMHNPPSYYMEKGKITFEQMFQPAVFDRFIPIKVTGRVSSKNSFQDPTIDFERVVGDNMDYYKNFIGRLIWVRNKGSLIKLKYSLDKYDLSYDGREETSSRWMNTWIRYGQLVQEYSDSEDEFYKLMDKIYSCHLDAKKEIKELGLMV